MNGQDGCERHSNDLEKKSELDTDEGADVMETLEEAIDAQRNDAPKRRDEDVISLDPGD